MPSLARNLSDDAQDKLLACSEDQRARNARYRQRQLHLLHGFLRQYATKLCQLITKESESTDEETWYEFSATLATISKLFHQLDFDDAIKCEYAISRNQSNTTNRVPHGIVLVRPGNHTIFYSIFAAVAAALAAGNFVAIEGVNTDSPLIGFLIEEFTVLDPDLFSFIRPNPNPNFLSKCFVIDQIDLPPPAGSSAALRLTPSYTVAIVDRTADISLAAQALCAARFSFKGKSPYAPDVVIVNEWVLEPFIRACIREIRGDSLIRETDTTPKPGNAQVQGNTTLYSDGAFEIVLDASGAKIQKEPRSAMRVLPSTNLVGAVTTASQYGTLLAGYYFGSNGACKFLQQSIESKLAFINNIPVGILIGPARPDTALNTVYGDGCYDLAYMSKPSPVSISTSIETSSILTQASDFGSRGMRIAGKGGVSSFKKIALKPLPTINQNSGTGSGFFDQGIMTGLIAFVLPTVTVAGWVIFQTARYLGTLY